MPHDPSAPPSERDSAPPNERDFADLSVIIVNWNVRDLLRNCLNSLLASPGIAWIGGPTVSDSAAQPPDEGGLGQPLPTQRLSAEVIVVDNASNDGSTAMLEAVFPWVRLVASPENRGFAGGNNLAIPLSRGRYVLFLNPDTEVLGNALAAMVACMKDHPEIGVLGPELRYGDGSRQSSRRRFPTFGMALFESTPLAWRWPDNTWARRYHMDDVPVPGADPGEVQVVDWVVGAALLVRREALEQVGGFDEGYFMYSEELDWCRRAKTANWQAAYFSGAQVVHHEGKSSEQGIAARHIRFQTSKVRYFRKVHGVLTAWVLQTSILAMFSIEWGLEAVKWLLGSRRDLRRERMAAYGQLLKSGLRET
jgi:N-acetylglucosaminyl-diphospho-decaprenol L-rhamnosyltransferase